MKIQRLLLLGIWGVICIPMAAMEEYDIDAISLSTKKLLLLLSKKDKDRALSDTKCKELIKKIEREGELKERMNLYNTLIYEITKKEFEANPEAILNYANEEGKGSIKVQYKGLEKDARDQVLLCKYLNVSYHVYAYYRNKFKLNTVASDALSGILKKMKARLKAEEGVAFFSNKDAQKAINNYSQKVYEKWKKNSNQINSLEWYVSPAECMSFSKVEEFIYKNG